MFTGLVERTGVVVSFAQHDTASKAQTLWKLVVDAGPDFDRKTGDSIAVNGACLSDVNDRSRNQLSSNNPNHNILIFHVSPETLAKTSLHTLKQGSLVNLERAMQLSDRLGGHIVLGHVDGVAFIKSLKNQGDFWLLELQVSKNLSRYIAPKGSLAVDGISLTVNTIVDETDHSIVSFTIIPITWSNTRLKTLSSGESVNIETDILAKHVERLLQKP